LGMSILRRVIGLYVGRVWVEREDNKDTSIFFGIPKRTEAKPL